MAPYYDKHEIRKVEDLALRAMRIASTPEAIAYAQVAMRSVGAASLLNGNYDASIAGDDSNTVAIDTDIAIADAIGVAMRAICRVDVLEQVKEIRAAGNGWNTEDEFIAMMKREKEKDDNDE